MSNVLNLNQYKKKKFTKETLTKTGREPLFVSYLPKSNTDGTDFADRLTAVRTSLDKINRLMSELKKLSERND